jgi:superfamily II DNA or RNA helicase
VILERFPREGFLTNIIGTLNVAELCVELGVRQFVNISTDKAAEPKNVLGFSKMLAEILEDVLTPGRQILVLSDRVQHCKDILEALSPELQEKACILAQTVPAPKRAEWCSSKSILIATYSMCKEGFDVASLNTLMMATPRPDIDQIVGRILRTEKSKRTINPLILDIVDSTMRRQFQQRLVLYKKRNYTIDMMEI